MNPLLKRLIKAPVVELFSHRPLRQVICWRLPRRHGKIALTFDDGPHPIYTPQVLDILAEHSLQGTFFVLGELVEKHPDVFRRLVAEGHEVGVHGYFHTHDNLDEQTLRTLDVISRFGVTSSLFRPPNGILPARAGLWMLRNRFSMVFWSFDARDSMRHEGKDSYHRPYDELGPGDILLMHDDNPVCVADLREVAGVIHRKGLRTGVISELLSI